MPEKDSYRCVTWLLLGRRLGSGRGWGGTEFQRLPVTFRIGVGIDSYTTWVFNYGFFLSRKESLGISFPKSSFLQMGKLRCKEGRQTLGSGVLLSCHLQGWPVAVTSATIRHHTKSLWAGRVLKQQTEELIINDQSFFKWDFSYIMNPLVNAFLNS